MATKNKIIEMLAAIKTVYPFFGKENNVDLMIQMWMTLMGGYDDVVLEAALFRCLQICKMPPTPADVIEQADALLSVNTISNEELWTLYVKVLYEVADQVSRFEYTYVDDSGISQGQKARARVAEIWANLPEILKHYLVSKGELIHNAVANDNDPQFSQWEKYRFLKAMPAIPKRIEYSDMLHKAYSDDCYALPVFKK